MFIPMIILGLYELFEGDKSKFYKWFIIGYVGILNSHLVMSVYFTAFVMIYILLNIKKVFKKENIKALLIACLLILLLTAPFTVPLIQHKLLGAYTVFEGETMASYGTIIVSTLKLPEFIIQKPSTEFADICYYLNLLALFMAILTIVCRKKLFKEEKEKKFFWFLVILTVVSIFMISELCPWKSLPKIMIMIQFTWRIETILVMALSILASLILTRIKDIKPKLILTILIIVFNLYTAYCVYNPEQIKELNMEELDMSYWGMGWEKEYLPEITNKNLDYFDNRGNEIIVKEGNANIEIINDRTPDLEAKIENCDNAKIELPRIYYLGYKAILKNDSGNEKELQLYMNDKGFIETTIDSNGTIILKYEGTTADKLANVACFITIGGLIIYWIIRKRKKILYIEDKKEEL